MRRTSVPCGFAGNSPPKPAILASFASTSRTQNWLITSTPTRRKRSPAPLPTGKTTSRKVTPDNPKQRTLRGNGDDQNRRTEEQKNRRTEEQKNRRTEEQKNRRTEEQKNRRTEEQKNRRTEEQKNRRTEEQKNRRTEEQKKNFGSSILFSSI